MSKREKIEKCIIYIAFGFYIILLAKILFLSRLSYMSVFGADTNRIRAVNLVPFFTIKSYIISRSITSGLFFANVVGNMIIFAPFGACLAFLKKDKRIWPNILIIFISSLAVEVLQWVFVIGSADVDDVILNCAGGLIGVFGYRLLRYIMKDDRKIQTMVAVVSALSLPVLYYYLFIIKMRF